MWDALFYVCGSEHGKRPEEVAKIRVNEHGAGHATDCEISSFCDTVLRGGIGNGFLVCDAFCFAILFHLALNKLGCVVNVEDFEFFTGEVFSHCLELGEQGECFVA
jgi:hypothetical protein